MTHLSDPPDDGAVLAAYLDGDTDEVTTARLERRLASDPALGARLDAIAATRMRLQRVDGVPPPPGLADRIDIALRELRTEQRPASGTAAASPGEVAVAPNSRLAHATSRRRRAATLLAAAAGFLVVAVIGAGAVRGFGGLVTSGGAEESAVSAADVQADSGSGDGDQTAPLAPEAGMRDDRGTYDGQRGGASTTDGDDVADDAAADPGIADEGPATQSAPGGESAARPRQEAAAPARVDTDAQLAQRLRALRSEPGEPLARERMLRERFGLPSTPLCSEVIGASIIDIVRRDDRVVVAALVGSARPPSIVIVDPRTCAQIGAVPATP